MRYGPHTAAASEDRPKGGSLATLKALWPYLRPYRAIILLAGFALFFVSTAVLGLGQGLQYLIDSGFGDGAEASTMDHAFLVMLGVTALLALASFARFYLVSRIGEYVIVDIRKALYRHIIHQDIAYFELTRTGELLSRMTTDLAILQMVMSTTFPIAVRNGLLLLFGTALLIATSPTLTGYVFLIVPIVVVPIIVIGRKVRRFARKTQDCLADLSVHTEETIGGVRTIKAFALEDRESRRFGRRAAAMRDMAMHKVRWRSLLTALVIFLVFGAITGVLWLGSRAVLAGEMTGGTLSAFVFYAVVVAGAVGSLSEVLGDLLKASGASERVFTLLQSRPQITSPIGEPAHLPERVEGRVQFDNVSFYYPTRPDTAALHNMALDITPGETVALVGPSGAGKSTTFHLLLRFYDPRQGVIRLDGVALHDLEPSELRRHIGIVPQDPVIFSANAWENIRYGKPEASREEILAAAEAAQARTFLEELPDGLDTYLGEKGVTLSGGQKQRLAIARAVLKDPEVLLLDEATSALDAENERLVQQALEKVMEGRTTLVIAHRLSTVQRADRIIVLDDGRIVAMGTHDSLMRQSDGLYQRLATLQMQMAG